MSYLLDAKKYVHLRVYIHIYIYIYMYVIWISMWHMGLALVSLWNLRWLFWPLLRKRLSQGRRSHPGRMKPGFQGTSALWITLV